MRRSRIPAAEAPPGLYLARNGRPIEIVDLRSLERKARDRRTKAVKRGDAIDSYWKPWPRRPSPDAVAYRAWPRERAKDALWHVTARGWLPADYPLLAKETR